ncbi:hypothetical protein JRG19_09885 [Pseudoclavibacter alba]|uniref:hypothetical protein n=1 Tax=Pseudoclavibacter albus TaxID=272241 RepID=UPI0019D171AC|nr:hypothetical protein [Pseudoclavibacter alba]MBN6778838.1 hypothetical protein [Pseudoclavibacter alba]
MFTTNVKTKLAEIQEINQALDMLRSRGRTNRLARRALIASARGAGLSIAAIAEAVGLSRNALYKLGIPDTELTPGFTREDATRALAENRAERLSIESDLHRNFLDRDKRIRQVFELDSSLEPSDIAEHVGLTPNAVGDIKRGRIKKY